MNDATIAGLPARKTWLLVVLSIVTYFVYPAHYARKLSVKLNAADPAGPKISSGLVWTVLIAAYVGLVLFLCTAATEEDSAIDITSNVVDRIGGLLFLVWAFSARRRLNFLQKNSKESPRWVHGFWTFLFAVFYLNYKVAKLKCEAAARLTPPVLAS